MHEKNIEMTYIVSGGALNSTHSLTHSPDTLGLMITKCRVRVSPVIISTAGSRF